MAERIASGEIYIDVNDREAVASLRRIEADFDRAMANIDRQEADVKIKGDLDELKRDLKEAEALTKAYDKRIADAENNRSKAQLRRQKELRKAEEDALRARVAGAEKATRAQAQENKQLDLTQKRVALIEKREQALERVRDQAARREAQRSRQRLTDINRESQRRAKLEQQRARELTQDEKHARNMERERSEVPKLEAAYAKLHDRMERLAEARRKAKGDERATFFIDIKEEETLDKINHLREEVRRRVGRDPIAIPVRPDLGHDAGTVLRNAFLRHRGVLRTAAADVGADIGRHIANNLGRGFTSVRQRGIVGNVRALGRNIGGSIGSASLAGLNKVGHMLSGLSEMTIRLGPFTSTIRQFIVMLSLFAPIILDVVGALGSLVSVVGSASLGVGALGAAFLGGAIPAAIGMFAVIKPLVGQFKNAMKATKAYNDALMKGNTELAAKKLKELHSVLGNVDKQTLQNFKSAGKLRDRFNSLTDGKGQARANVFGIIGEGIAFANRNLSTFASKTNATSKALRGGLTSFMRNLDMSAVNTMWDNFNKSLQPGLKGLENLFNYLLRVGAVASHFLPGLANTFKNWSKGILDTTNNTEQFNAKIKNVIQSAKDVGRWFMSAGRLMKAFFSAGVGSGQDFANDMSNTMDRWTASLQTIEGKNNLKAFFDEARQGAESLWNTLAPVISSFVRWAANIAPFARAFFDAASAVSHFVSELLRVTGLRGPVMALATTLGALWSISKIGAATRAVAGFTTALLGMSRAQGAVAATRGAATLSTGGAAVASRFGAGAVAAEAGAVRAAAGMSKMARAGSFLKTGLAGLGGLVTGFSSVTAGLGVVAVAAGAGMYLWANRTQDWEKASKSAMESTNRYREIIGALPGAELQAAQGVLSRQQAHMDLSNTLKQSAAEQRELNAMERAGKKGTADYDTLLQQHKGTLLQVRQARLNDLAAQQDQKKTIDDIRKASQRMLKEATGAYTKQTDAVNKLGDNKLADEFQTIEKHAKAAHKSVSDYIKEDYSGMGHSKESLLAYAAAVDELRKKHDDLHRAMEAANLSELNIKRGLQGLAPMAEAAGRALLNVSKLGGKSLATKISLKYDDPGKAARVASSASKALSQGVKPARIRFVVENAKSAEQAIRRINAMRMTNKTLGIIVRGGNEAIKQVERIIGKKIPEKSAKIIAKGGPAAIAEMARIAGFPLPKKWQHVAETGSTSVIGMLARIIGIKLGDKTTLLKAIDHATSVIAALSGSRTIGQRIIEIVTKRKGNAVGGVADPREKKMPFVEDRAFKRAAQSSPRSTKGGRYARPTLLVGEEDRAEFVISTNPAYRSSNVDYLRAAAAALGVTTAKKGKKGQKAATEHQLAGARHSAASKIRKRVKHRTHYNNENLVELKGVEAAKRAEDNQARQIQIDEGKMKEPQSFIKQIGSDPATGDPLYSIDEGAIKGWADQLNAMAAKYQTLMDLIDTVGQKVAAAMKKIGDPFHRGDKTGIIGQTYQNEDTLRAMMKHEDKIIGGKKSSRAAVGMAKERKRAYAAALNDELESRRSATQDWKQLDDERNDVGFRKQDATNARDQYTNDAAAVRGNAQTAASDANPQAPKPTVFSGAEGALGGLDAEAALAAIGQGLGSNPARSLEAINADKLTQNQSIINSAQALLKDADPGNDQSAYQAIQTAAGNIASLTGADQGGTMGQIAAFGSARSDLYRNMGSNFALAAGFGSSGSVFGSGAFGQNYGTFAPSGTQQSGPGITNVTVNNTFPTPPPDPHTWSTGVAWELQAAV